MREDSFLGEVVECLLIQVGYWLLFEIVSIGPRMFILLLSDYELSRLNLSMI